MRKPANIVLKPLSSLKRWEGNYRVGAVERIVDSIVQFGFNGALRVWTGDVVMAGNHTYLALARMQANGAKPPRGIVIQSKGWMVPCIDVSHLTRIEAQAFAIADNRLAELAENDGKRLAELLTEITAADKDLASATGYNDSDLRELLKAAKQSARQEQDDTGAEDPEAEGFGEVRPKEGDIWELGEHRLFCGDATDKGAIERMAAGRRADLVFTDPPYGVDYVGKTDNALRIQNDNLGHAGTRLLVAELLRAAPARPGSSLYVCSPSGDFELAFRLAFIDAQVEMKQTIVWTKNSFVLGRSDYHYQHETILYGAWPGGKRYFTDDRTKSTVWAFDKPHRNGDHPTMKPVALVEEAIQNSSRPGDLVYDGCVGSGTTLIGCERTSRICFAADKDPRYAEVTLRRWEQMTGQEARLLT